MPCAYVELIRGQQVDVPTLLAYAADHITERAAVPKHVEILASLPKTAVGKVFKPDLRRLAITRVLDAALAQAGQPATVQAVVEDKKRGLVARIARRPGTDDATIATTLGQFSTAWEWSV